MSRPKVNFKEKVQKENPEFVAEVASLSVEQLDGRLAQLAKDQEAVEQARDADEELELAKENVAVRSGPYSDSRKALRMKSKYIIELLKEKGQ